MTNPAGAPRQIIGVWHAALVEPLAHTLAALGSDPRPKLIIWGEADPILPIQTVWRFARAIGAEVDHAIPGVGHFLQEDAGHQVGRMIAGWLKTQVPAKR